MLQATGVICEHTHRFLYLRYSSLKPQSGRWGLPGGSLNPEEDPLAGIARELYEETGISTSNFTFLHVFDNFSPTGIPYRFHLYHLKLTSLPSISLSPEHDSYAWVSASEASKLPLAHNADKGLTHYLSHSQSRGTEDCG